MRELPFSVWKARRTEVISFRSFGVLANWANASRAVCITSRASSRKMSRISVSSSSPVWPGGTGGAATAGGGSGFSGAGLLACASTCGLTNSVITLAACASASLRSSPDSAPFNARCALSAAVAILR